MHPYLESLNNKDNLNQITVVYFTYKINKILSILTFDVKILKTKGMCCIGAERNI